MMRRSILLLYVLLGVAAVAQQPKANSSVAHPVLEFPAILQEGVVAGKTPVGTAVHSKLMIATLVNGVVIPQDALLVGRVEESTARTKSDPSRLKIRIDVAQWKGGSLSLNAFLTNIYYANRLIEAPPNEGSPDASADGDLTLFHGGHHQNSLDLESSRATLSRQSAGSPASGPNHSGDMRWENSVYRKPMRNVDLSRDSSGAAFILSVRDNIKLERNTAYCFVSR